MGIYLLLSIALSMTNVALQTSPVYQSQSLTNIPALRVRVAELTQDAIADGLRVDELKTDAEIRLGSAGIEVDSESAPYVLVRINYIKSIAPQGWDIGYFGSISVALYQPVIPIASGETVDAVTWEVSLIFSGLPGDGRESIRQMLGDCMDRFIKDYLEANPKK